MIIILSIATGLILMVNVLFNGEEFLKIIPFLFSIAIFLVYGIVIIAGANRQNLEKIKKAALIRIENDKKNKIQQEQNNNLTQ